TNLFVTRLLRTRYVLYVPPVVSGRARRSRGAATSARLSDALAAAPVSRVRPILDHCGELRASPRHGGRWTENRFRGAIVGEVTRGLYQNIRLGRALKSLPCAGRRRESEWYFNRAKKPAWSDIPRVESCGWCDR